MVTASTTRLTDIYGVGPIIAATVLGFVGDISWLPTRDHFAAYNGTAPIEVSAGRAGRPGGQAGGSPGRRPVGDPRKPGGRRASGNPTPA